MRVRTQKFLILILVLFLISFSQRLLASSTNCGLFSGEYEWLNFYPLSNLTLRTYNLSGNSPFGMFRLYNSDGDFIKKGSNLFLQLNGELNLFRYFNFYYRLQMKNKDNVYLHRLNVFYRDRYISIGAGMDSVWLGHGIHGSLLLSNNAYPLKLVKFQTENPVKLPYIGKFKYLLFNGWAKNFKILGQKLSYLPLDWFEFGINQTVIYKQNYKFWEFFKVISASQENLPGYFNNDQRASLDVAINLNFLNSFTPIKRGKIFYEYAGEDIYAWWQKEDGKWIGPVGFEFFDTGYSFGLWIETEKNHLIFEYSQNYKIKNLFREVHTGTSYQNFTKKWYRTVPFINYDAIMGHHMGPEADDFYFEFKHSFKLFDAKIIFHKERHGLASGYGTVYNASDSPEIVFQYGLEIKYYMKNFNATLLLMVNDYNNIDRNPDLLEIMVERGSYTSFYIFGLSFSYYFY